jgi:uncharacterized RDD family membrane protein YckC
MGRVLVHSWPNDPNREVTALKLFRLIRENIKQLDLDCSIAFALCRGKDKALWAPDLFVLVYLDGDINWWEELVKGFYLKIGGPQPQDTEYPYWEAQCTLANLESCIKRGGLEIEEGPVIKRHARSGSELVSRWRDEGGKTLGVPKTPAHQEARTSHQKLERAQERLANEIKAASRRHPFASIIDMVICLVVPSFAKGYYGLNSAGNLSISLLLGSIWALTFFLYSLAFEGWLDGTIGKRMLRIRVVNSEGKFPLQQQIILRETLKLLEFFLPACYYFWSPDAPLAGFAVLFIVTLVSEAIFKRYLHDRVAGTYTTLR